MKKTAQLLMFVFAVSFSALSVRAQNQPKSTVWIDPTSPYTNYLEASVLKKHTPVTLTTNKESAQYTATVDADIKREALRERSF